MKLLKMWFIHVSIDKKIANIANEIENQLSISNATKDARNANLGHRSANFGVLNVILLFAVSVLNSVIELGFHRSEV